MKLWLISLLLTIVLAICLQNIIAVGGTTVNKYKKHVTLTFGPEHYINSSMASSLLACSAQCSMDGGCVAFTYQDQNCTRLNGAISGSTSNTTVYFNAQQMPDMPSCPYETPYAFNDGLNCCQYLKKVNNQTVSPACNGGTLALTDPAECCAGIAVLCTDTLGCGTARWTKFNASKALLLSYTGASNILDMFDNNNSASNTSNNPLPSYNCVGSYGTLMLVCDCYPLISLVVNQCLMRDFGSTTWFPAPNITVLRNRPAYAMVQQSKLWVIGGNTATTEMFDFKTQTWTSGPTSFPSSNVISYPVAAALDDHRVIVAGGYNSVTHGNTRTTNLFDFSTGQWTQLADLAYDRQGAGMGALSMPGGSLAVVIAGGYSHSYGALNSVELYDVTADAWTTLAGTLFYWIQDVCVCVLNGRALLFSGLKDGSVPIDQLFEFNTSSLAFEQVGTLKQNFSYGSCIPYN